MLGGALQRAAPATNLIWKSSKHDPGQTLCQHHHEIGPRQSQPLVTLITASAIRIVYPEYKQPVFLPSPRASCEIFPFANLYATPSALPLPPPSGPIALLTVGMQSCIRFLDDTTKPPDRPLSLTMAQFLTTVLVSLALPFCHLYPLELPFLETRTT